MNFAAFDLGPEYAHRKMRAMLLWLFQPLLQALRQYLSSYKNFLMQSYLRSTYPTYVAYSSHRRGERDQVGKRMDVRRQGWLHREEDQKHQFLSQLLYTVF